MVMALGTSTAWASDGRIGFAGAIVAPTCSASDAHIGALMSAGQSSQVAVSVQFSCRSTGNVAPGEATTYSLSIARLDSITANHDRLLVYFVGYLNAADHGSAQPKVVTQIFA